MRLAKTLGAYALGAVAATGAFYFATPVAQAYIACNRSGECWHTSQRYTEYPASLGIQFYSDDWRKEHESDMRYRWMPDRDPDSGYYSDGQWRPFR